jgi:hypothetical protein
MEGDLDITQKTAIELVLEERHRQTSVEGFTTEHDDEHTKGELANAAACYAMTQWTGDNPANDGRSILHNVWPKSWSLHWWKPSPENRIRELTKAGALILAEIERLQRLEDNVRT